MAARHHFLKLDDIQGESLDDKHKDEIELESWWWGAEQKGGSAVGGGAGVGKVQMGDFYFTTRTNKATPKLGLACWNGKPIPKVVLTCRKAGEDQQEFLKITLSDALCSSHSISGNQDNKGDLHPVDKFSLNFAKVEIEYSPQKADGKLDSPQTAGWDLKANKKV